MTTIIIYNRDNMKILGVFSSETEAQRFCAGLGHGHYMSRTSFMYMDDVIEVEFDIK